MAKKKTAWGKLRDFTKKLTGKEPEAIVILFKDGGYCTLGEYRISRLQGIVYSEIVNHPATQEYLRTRG